MLWHAWNIGNILRGNNGRRGEICYGCRIAVYFVEAPGSSRLLGTASQRRYFRRLHRRADYQAHEQRFGFKEPDHPLFHARRARVEHVLPTPLQRRLYRRWIPGANYCSTYPGVFTSTPCAPYTGANGIAGDGERLPHQTDHDLDNVEPKLPS